MAIDGHLGLAAGQLLLRKRLARPKRGTARITRDLAAIAKAVRANVFLNLRRELADVAGAHNQPQGRLAND